MPKRFRPAMLGVLFSMLVLPIIHIHAQSQHMPRGTAIVLPHDDLMAIKQRSADKPVNDTQVAVASINNDEYHLAVGIAHRSKASVDTPGGGGVEHSDITEVYYIISGTAILNTGGTVKDLKDPKPGAPNGPSGPTASGGEIVGGVTKAVGPGDVIVIPPNTPHRFSAINTDEIVYVLVRPDPHKVLPAMNLLAK
jgi:mannose-6-phosphate isomerase-like protein (cupin superfamily)